MKKLILLAALAAPMVNASVLRDNTAMICMQIGLQKLNNFSVWDYDLSVRQHENKNYTVMYRHEDYSSMYLRCLYVRSTNTIEWNTMTTSGRIGPMPKGFHNKSMDLTLN